MKFRNPSALFFIWYSGMLCCYGNPPFYVYFRFRMYLTFIYLFCLFWIQSECVIKRFTSLIKPFGHQLWNWFWYLRLKQRLGEGSQEERDIMRYFSFFLGFLRSLNSLHLSCFQMSTFLMRKRIVNQKPVTRMKVL